MARLSPAFAHTIVLLDKKTVTQVVPLKVTSIFECSSSLSCVSLKDWVKIESLLSSSCKKSSPLIYPVVFGSLEGDKELAYFVRLGNISADCRTLNAIDKSCSSDCPLSNPEII